MKKITFLLFVFYMSLSFGQVSQYCDTAVTHFGGNPESEISLTIVNTGPNSVAVTASASDINFLFIVPPITGNPALSEDTSVSGQITQTLTWTGTPPDTVEFNNIQWRRTSTGGATWQLNESTPVSFAFSATCAGPGADVSLSDLQVDGVTIDGFTTSTTTYEISQPNPTPVPQITSVMPTNSNATVGTITQAAQVPGTASFVVTSEDMSAMQTYTINFIVAGPPTAAPDTPTFQNSSDYSSVFSSLGGAVGLVTSSFAGATEETVSIDSDDTKKLTITTPGGGMNFAFAPQDLSGNSLTRLYFNYYFEGTLEVGKLINVNIQGTGANLIYQVFLNPTTRTADQWVTVDVALTDLMNGTDPTNAISQVQFSGAGGSNPFGTVHIDNLLFYQAGALSIDDKDFSETVVYPNPASSEWTIRASNTVIETIELFDILGKRVISLKPNSQEATIDASGLGTGIYLARLSANGASKTIRLIRQ